MSRIGVGTEPAGTHDFSNELLVQYDSPSAASTLSLSFYLQVNKLSRFVPPSISLQTHNSD